MKELKLKEFTPNALADKNAKFYTRNGLRVTDVELRANNSIIGSVETDEGTSFRMLWMPNGWVYEDRTDSHDLMIADCSNETHEPSRYEVLPGLQAWDILRPICNRFTGMTAALIFNIGKYYMRLGMKDDVIQELEKMREYVDKSINEIKSTRKEDNGKD